MSGRAWGRAAALALLIFTAVCGQAWAAAGQMTGTVTDEATHAAIQGVDVTVYDSNEQYVASTPTSAAGGYTLSGLAPGVYEVGFDDGTGVHASEFYNDRKSLFTADAITVASGQTTTGVDAALATAGGIGGTVTGAPTATPLAGVTVAALDPEGDWLSSTTTNASGAYVLHGLAAGGYTVGFFPDQGKNYLSQYYDGQSDQANANTVNVSAGTVTQGVNAQLDVGGTITGHVTSASDGVSLQGIEVTAFGDTGSGYGTATTDAQGDYTIVGLPDDSYTVSFYSSDGSYVSEEYNNQPTFQTPDLVPVTTGNESSGIDAALEPAARLSGKVTDASSDTQLHGIEAIAYDPDGNAVAWADTDETGAYTLGSLPAGTYRVGFFDVSGAGYVPQFYNGKPTLQSADTISANAGQNIGGIDAAMQSGGKITGTVTDAQTHAPVAFSSVYVYDSNGAFVAGTSTGSDGAYTLSSLPTGSYRVQFTGPGLYVSRFYDGKANLASADPVAVTAGSTTSHIDAALQDGGSIAGTVTDNATGLPLSRASVYVTGLAGVWAANTDSQGHYSVSGLPTGSYELEFWDGGYLPQFYNHHADASNADPLSVTSGQTIPNVDGALSPGATITGTLTDAQTGQPISGETVFADNANGQPVASASTGSDGRYQLSGLTTGSYEVGFGVYGTGPNYVPGYYNGAQCSATAGTSTSAGQAQYSGAGITCTPTSAGASQVAATESQTTPGIDGAMQPGAVISGTVTDAATNARLQNIAVTVYDSSGGYLGQTYTASQGTYFLDSLPAGNYKVGFSNGASNFGYLPQYYTAKASLSTADTVTLASAASKTGIDAAMQSGGQVSGTIVDGSTHQPISNVYVAAYDSNGFFAASASTNSTGKYTLAGLATGSYRIEFQSFSGGYATQYYNGRQTLASADPVSVTIGQTTSGINASLSTGGSITGIVTDATQGNAPVSGISVTAYSYSGNSTTYAGSATTDSTGHYSITGLLTGSYKVQFAGGGYVTQFYDGQASTQAAGPVGVTYGQATGNINAALQEGGSITGTVTDASSQTAVASAFATAYNSQGIPVSAAFTGSNGTYQISGLPAGSYRVGFNQGSNRNYLPQYYNGQTSLGSASEITVSTGQTTSGIDAALQPGGQIYGTVTDASTDAPVSGIWVYAMTTDGQFVTSAPTNSQGAYSIGGLNTGSYSVEFYAPSSTQNYLPQYYSNKTTLQGADAISVTAGQAATGINAAMQPGGQITGTITSSTTGNPIAGVQVTASGSSAYFATTDTNGGYTLNKLPTGSYQLYFSDPAGLHLPQYYNNKTSSSTADQVPVTAGQTTSAINVSMAPAGRITGTIADVETTAPIPGINVALYDSSGTYVSTAQTDSQGVYAIGTLAPGTYKVQFTRSDSNGNSYGPQYYNAKSTLASADPITVTGESTTGAINARLLAIPANTAASDGHRHGATGADPHRAPRQLDAPPDLLRLPVDALQPRRNELRGDRRRDRPGLRPGHR